jgi:putative ABC transport system ATP-binding protein
LIREDGHLTGTSVDNKTAQCCIPANAQEVGCSFVPNEETERRCLLAAPEACKPGVPPSDRATNRSMLIDDLLDAKEREFKPQFAGVNIRCRCRISQFAEALPIAKGVSRVGSSKAKTLEIQIDLGIGGEGQSLSREGEYLSIMGPSGSGKSTLFNMIGGLSKPTSGKVFIDQVDIAQLDNDELAWLRCRKIGYIFQTYNLLQTMSCLENVMLPMSFAGLDQEQAQDKAVEILELVGLGHRLLHKPSELSGGQQQRVAIARSLANSPGIILADEPTASLDQKTGDEMIELLARLQNELGVTIISATHDLKMLQRSDRIMWIADGRIDKVARPEEIDFSGHDFH